MPSSRVLLLVGHGTISNVDDIPEFLRRIRRGRPASVELVEEIRRRYTHIGRSPLLDTTNAVAAALAGRLGFDARVAMRFWHPFIEDVARELVRDGVREVCILPVAPFSVSVYADVVAEAIARASESPDVAPRLLRVPPFGSHPALISAHAENIRRVLSKYDREHTELVLSAHSLPTRVIAAGDDYQREFEASAHLVEAALGVTARIAYQSQGADGGDWLGPRLDDTIRAVSDAGKKRVVVAPVGFLADHVETLYDLDVEAAEQARSLGLQFDRVPALNDAPLLLDALEAVARNALA